LNAWNAALAQNTFTRLDDRQFFPLLSKSTVDRPSNYAGTFTSAMILPEYYINPYRTFWQHALTQIIQQTRISILADFEADER
jgi:hypothetical protein